MSTPSAARPAHHSSKVGQALAKAGSPDVGFVLAGYGLVAAAGLVSWALWSKWGHTHVWDTAKVPATISIWAPFYAIAQSIERLLDPLANLAGNVKTQNGSGTARLKKTEAVAKLRAATTPEQHRNALDLLERIRRNTSVLVWGVATALGMLAAGGFGILLLTAVGIDIWQPADVWITGLAIGSGTKPLHDLIGKLQKDSGPSSGSGSGPGPATP